MYIIMNFYYPQLTATKLSVLLMYRRIFPVQPILKVGWKKATWYTRGWWFVLFLVVGYGFSFFFIYMFYLTPIASGWTPFFPKAEQHNIGPNYIWIGAALNMFNDVCILSLPVGNIVKLRLPLNQRVLLVFIFMLGSFVTLASAARLYFNAIYLINVDAPYVAVTSYIWSQVEIFTGLICACLPVLGPIVAKSMGRSIFTPKSSQRSSPVSTLRREHSFISEKLRSPDSPDFPRSIRSHSRLRPDTEKDLEAGRTSTETGGSRHTSTSTYERSVPQMPKMSFENTQAPPLPKLKSGQGKPVARGPGFREGDEVMDNGVLAGPDPPHDPRHEEHMSPTPWREPNSFDLERQTEYQQNIRVAQLMASRGQDENRQSLG